MDKLDKIVLKIRNSKLSEDDVLKYGRILITEFAKDERQKQLLLYDVGKSFYCQNESDIIDKERCKTHCYNCKNLNRSQ